MDSVFNNAWLCVCVRACVRVGACLWVWVCVRVFALGRTNLDVVLPLEGTIIALGPGGAASGRVSCNVCICVGIGVCGVSLQTLFARPPEQPTFRSAVKQFLAASSWWVGTALIVLNFRLEAQND